MITDSLGRVAQIGRLVGNPIIVALSTNSARSTILKPYTAYRIWSSVASFIVFGGAAVDATSSSNPMAAGSSDVFWTDASNRYLAGIVATGTGSLYISELDLG